MTAVLKFLARSCSHERLNKGYEMNNITAGERKALVVDDEAGLLQVLERILVEAHFVTTCVPLGQPALDLLDKHHFDLLIVDVGLPDMNGMRICAAARERYGDSTTIFVITADNRQQRCVTALEIGADDFLAKPFDTEELLARIDVKLRRTSDIKA